MIDDTAEVTFLDPPSSDPSWREVAWMGKRRPWSPRLTPHAMPSASLVRDVDILIRLNDLLTMMDPETVIYDGSVAVVSADADNDAVVGECTAGRARFIPGAVPADADDTSGTVSADS